jgi:hypothetical protein
VELVRLKTSPLLHVKHRNLMPPTELYAILA